MLLYSKGAQLFVCYLLQLLVVTAYGQSRIQGTLTDAQTNTTIAGATVLIHAPQNTRPLSFTFSDDRGQFALETTADSVVLKIAMLSYLSIDTLIVFSDLSTVQLDLQLAPQGYELEEVSVRAYKTGIIRNGDTLRYDPTQFKTGTEQNLGDLLQRLPGISVEEDGTIIANGQRVDKILLDGDDLMNNNRQTLLRGVQADAVAFIDYYAQDNKHQDGEEISLNIRLTDEAKRKWNGQGSIGATTDRRFQLENSLFRLGKKLKIFSYFRGNNLDQQALSIQDFFNLNGGMLSFVQDAQQFSPEVPLVFQATQPVQQNLHYFPTVNLSYNPSSPITVQTYLTGFYNSNAQDVSSSQFNLADPNIFLLTDSTYTNNQYGLGQGRTSVRWKISKQLAVRGDGFYLNTRDQQKINNEFSFVAQLTPSTTTINGLTEQQLFRSQLRIDWTPNNLGSGSLQYGYQQKKLIVDKQFTADGVLPWSQFLLQDFTSHAQLYQANHTQGWYADGHYRQNFGNISWRTTLNINRQKVDLSQRFGALISTSDRVSNSLSLTTSLMRNRLIYNWQRLGLFAEAGVRLRGLKTNEADPQSSLLSLLPGVGLALRSRSNQRRLSLSYTQREENLIPDNPFGVRWPTNTGIVYEAFADSLLNNQSNGFNLFFLDLDILQGHTIALLANYSRNNQAVTLNQIIGTNSQFNQEVLSPSESLVISAQISKRLLTLKSELKLKVNFSQLENPFFIDNFQVKQALSTWRITLLYRTLSQKNFNLDFGGTISLHQLSLPDISTVRNQRWQPLTKLYWTSDRFVSTLTYEPIFNSTNGVSNQQNHYLNILLRRILSDRFSVVLSLNHLFQLKRDEQAIASFRKNLAYLQQYEQLPGYILLSIQYNL